MKVKFSRCNSNNLSNVPQVDGQLIFVKDNNEIYIDVGNNRNKVGDVIQVANIQNVASPLLNKIYFDESTDKLYKPTTENNNIVWINLSGGNQASQVYFWNGGDGAEDVALWNEILEASTHFPVAVFYNGTYVCAISSAQQILTFGATFISVSTPTINYDDSDTGIETNKIVAISFTFNQDNTIASIDHISAIDGTTGKFLSTDTDYAIPYTPVYDGSPTTKQYVMNTFQRKPVVIWESNTPSEYLKAIQADLSASPTWQLTDLDLTAFKTIKIYSCAGQGTGSTASASTTPSIVLEMSLDPRASIAAYGGNYIASVVVQKPNDANRLATLTCVVSADKTKFTVLRQTNLYGTAATSNNDVNANVFMIKGYYD